MTKRDLVKKLQSMFPDFPVKDIGVVVDVIFRGMEKALARDEKIEIRNFGVFGITKRVSSIGRNPRTGEAVYIPGRNIAFFKTGKELQERINRQPDSYET